MPQSSRGFGIHPFRCPCASVPGRCKLPTVARPAVDVIVLTVVDGVEVQLLGASGAVGALFVITLAMRVDFFSLKNGTSTSWTVLLFIGALDGRGVVDMKVDIGCADLWAIFLIVAHLTVEFAVRPVVVGQAVQLPLAFNAPEAVLVVPVARGRDHFLGLKNSSGTFWTTILIPLLGLDDPGLDGGPGQHVIMSGEQLWNAHRSCPSETVCTSRHRP